MDDNRASNGPGSVSPWGLRSSANGPALVGLTLAGLVLCLWLALPFLPSLTWTITLVILFLPTHRRIEAIVKRPNLAASISVLIVALIVVLPLLLVIRQLLMQVAVGVQALDDKVENGAIEQTLQISPVLERIFEWVMHRVHVEEALRTIGTRLTETGAALVRGSVMEIAKIAVSFYLFFYLVRDRGLAMRSLRLLSPLTRPEMDRLLRRVADAVHATIFGTLAVAAIQGFLGGLIFQALGLPTPLLWGVVMGLLAIIPVLGAFIVWIPAAFLLLLDGHWIKALILVVWGALVVGTIDNFLGPVLVGKRLRLHPVNIFVTLVGGLFLLGGPGVVLGPVILAATIALLEIWRDRTAPGNELGTTPHGESPASRLG